MTRRKKPRPFKKPIPDKNKKSQKTWNLKYPWDRWLSQTRFKIVRGKHYDCMPHVMALQIRNEAFKRERKVSIRIVEETITVQVGNK